MSEDEKKAIDMLEKYITEHKFYNIKQSDGLEDNIKILLDLYMQEKEEKEELQEKLKEEIQIKNEYIDMLNATGKYSRIFKTDWEE